jgi:hypothetical protein
MIRVCLILTVLIGAPALFAAGPHPSLPDEVVPDGLGVNIHFTDAQPGELDMLAQGGFRWIRMDFTWAATERKRGRYDFAAYERLLAALEAHKLHAVFILDYANPLYEPNQSVVSAKGREAFSRWAAAAATHFKGHGILWEIWNEPNIGFWKPKPDVGQYSTLAVAASKAIRDAAPGEAIIGPATSGVDLKFLEGCFRAGLLKLWDAVSVHPYRPGEPESVAGDYNKLRELIARYAPAGKEIPVLSGEWGYSSTWKTFDDAKQGRMLTRQWLTNLANHIPLSIWYDWQDDGTDPHEGEHHFGTVRNQYLPGESPVYGPKLAYLAAKTLTATLAGFRFDKRLKLDSSEDYAFVFRKQDQHRIAVWTTSATRHSVKIPSAAGKFNVVMHTGEQAKPVSVVNGNAIEVTVSDDPQYLLIDGANPVLDMAPAFAK